MKGSLPAAPRKVTLFESVAPCCFEPEVVDKEGIGVDTFRRNQ